MRYFFNLGGEFSVDDPDGVELPDIKLAREHATAMAIGLMRRTKLFREGSGRWVVKVTDEEGREVIVVPFQQASGFANSQQETDQTSLLGQLSWRCQLHIGKQLASEYPLVANRQLPKHFGDLLDRLESRVPG